MRANALVALGAIYALTSGVGAAQQKHDAFQGVQQFVKERTGKSVRLEEDQAAREQVLQEIHEILRKPLTIGTAVQIALLNNQSLQATFQEIGLSAADLLEAATIPNPKIDLSVRFPNKPPSATYIDYSTVIDFLSIVMIPLKKRVAKDQLESVALRVADDTLELFRRSKRPFTHCRLLNNF